MAYHVHDTILHTVEIKEVEVTEEEGLVVVVGKCARGTCNQQVHTRTPGQ